MAKHLALMVALMYAGMLVLDPLYDFVTGIAGVSDPWGQLPVLSNFIMALNMTIPMVLYMLNKHYCRRVIIEMAAVMFLPAALTLGPYLLGTLTTGTMMAVSHWAMIPLMAVFVVFHFRGHAPLGKDNRYDAQNVLTGESTDSRNT